MSPAIPDRERRETRSQRPHLSFARALCALDGSPESVGAVRHAASLAGPGGHLTLLLVTAFRNEPELRSPAIAPERASEIIDEALAVAQEAGVEASVEVDPEGPPGRVVLEYCAGQDLLAIGTPATSWFGAMFMGGVAATAEEYLTRPLLISRAAGREVALHERILVASDGFETSDPLVAVAGELAAERGGSVTLLHVLDAESRMHPHRIERQAELLRGLLGERARVRVETGHARHVVIEAARAEDCSLVLLSSRALKGLHAVGSVSRRVVHRAPCPVLLIPPEQLQELGWAPVPV
jgi:nucleotide-binding universal stress UspA family protein